MGNIETLFQPETLQGILGNIRDGFILTDTEEHVLYSNPAACRILDYEECPGRTVMFSEICPLVDVTNGRRYPDPLRLAIAEKRSVGLAKDVGLQGPGGPIYLSATCSPIKAVDGGGRVLGGSVILRDVTQMRELEAELEKDQHYMRAVFSAARVGLCILDVDGEIVDINETGLAILETTWQDSVGLRFGDAFHCEDSQERGCGHSAACRHCPIWRNLDAAVMDDTFSGEFSMHIRSTRALQAAWLRLCISQSGTGRDKQIILTLVDESASKRYERQLEEARTAAEEASRTKSQFLTNMSHEIRTPINGMLGMMELVQREPLSDKQRLYLQNARQCSEDLLQVINDILDFARLESGRLVLENIYFDLHKTIQRMVETYRQLAREKGLELITPDIQSLPQVVRGDPLRLRQIFHNLLVNAVKFTAEGRITFGARVGRHREQPTLDFEVSDTGIGMDEDARRKLFQPFSQGDSSITRRFGGTGLGLMIVRELLDYMGGEIQVKSRPGQGSRFYFWIPLVEGSQVETERQERRVVLNPHPEGKLPSVEQKIAVPDAGVDDLMQYCLQKLQADDGEDRT